MGRSAEKQGKTDRTFTENAEKCDEEQYMEKSKVLNDFLRKTHGKLIV